MMAESEEISEADRAAWEAEFEAAARRPLPVRMRYAFIRTYKPVMDDATYRSCVPVVRFPPPIC